MPGKEARRRHAVAIGRELRLSMLAPQRNRLLAALNAEDNARLLPHLELVSLPRGTVICEARARSDYAYFPTDGIVSLLYELENGASVEVAVTGNDGMVGTAVFMGGGATTSRAVVRNGGQGYRIPARVLKTEFEGSAALRQLLLRYAQALTAQMAQTAVCRGRHQLEQQLCRMLLVSMDRLASAEVDLTQDAIAGLLGARRESVTAAAGRLQAAGLIRYHRGRITVLNRRLLEARVCECYAAAKVELDRLLPRRSRRRARRDCRGTFLPSGSRFHRRARRSGIPRRVIVECTPRRDPFEAPRDLALAEGCRSRRPSETSGARPRSARSAMAANRRTPFRRAPEFPRPCRARADPGSRSCPPRARARSRMDTSPWAVGLCCFAVSMPTPSSAMRSTQWSAFALQRDRHVLRLRVLGDVGQRFLHDAIERDAVGGRQPERLVLHLDSAGHVRPLAELAALPLQRGADAEIVE